jgi:hypothetical protein
LAPARISYNNASVGSVLGKQQDPRLEIEKVNKINSDKEKEKKFFVIIMINQIIGLIAAQSNRI